MSEAYAEKLRAGGAKCYDYGTIITDLGNSRITVKERPRTRKEKKQIDLLRQLYRQAKTRYDNTPAAAVFKRELKAEYLALEWALDQINAAEDINLRVDVETANGRKKWNSLEDLYGECLKRNGGTFDA